MEHIRFEVQLCMKISIFKGIWNIDILIKLCLGTSLSFTIIKAKKVAAECHAACPAFKLGSRAST